VSIDKTRYRKENPPTDLSTNSTVILVGIVIQELGEFQEISMQFRAKLFLQVSSFDLTLFFSEQKYTIPQMNIFFLEVNPNGEHWIFFSLRTFSKTETWRFRSKLLFKFKTSELTHLDHTLNDRSVSK
jgi:hypothetical protein